MNANKDGTHKYYEKYYAVANLGKKQELLILETHQSQWQRHIFATNVCVDDFGIYDRLDVQIMKLSVS